MDIDQVEDIERLMAIEKLHSYAERYGLEKMEEWEEEVPPYGTYQPHVENCMYTPDSDFFIVYGYRALRDVLAFVGERLQFQLIVEKIDSYGDLAYYNGVEIDRLPFRVYTSKDY